MSTLHYIFDPFCGWCYAAAPLLQAAQSIPGVTVELHAGGMLSGPARRTITPQWRDYVIPHDLRIRELSGQPFGAAYFDGLLRDHAAVLDSAPPITAILAAQALEDAGLAMLHRQQQAHYVEGRRIAEPAELLALAGELGLAAERFSAAFAEYAGTLTAQHITHSRQWLTRIGGRGFPSFALEDTHGALQTLEFSAWLGRPQAFADALRERSAATAATSAPDTTCGPTGCAI